MMQIDANEQAVQTTDLVQIRNLTPQEINMVAGGATGVGMGNETYQ